MHTLAPYYIPPVYAQLAHTFHLMQDYIVLCMDVGPSMDIAPPSGGETSLEMAIRVANQIVQQKVSLGVCVCVQCAMCIIDTCTSVIYMYVYLVISRAYRTLDDIMLCVFLPYLPYPIDVCWEQGLCWSSSVWNIRWVYVIIYSCLKQPQMVISVTV